MSCGQEVIVQIIEFSVIQCRKYLHVKEKEINHIEIPQEKIYNTYLMQRIQVAIVCRQLPSQYVSIHSHL